MTTRGSRSLFLASALSALPALGLFAEAAISQSLSVDLRQEAYVRSVRDDGPINVGDALGLPDWETNLEADADWDIDVGRRLRLNLSPKVSWTQAGRSIDDLPDAEIWIDRAEARLSFPEVGIEAVLGKLGPEFGANYIEPLSVTRKRGRDSDDDGLWMGGLFLAAGDVSIEAYCEAARDPEVVASLGALIGPNEAGLVYRRDYGSSLAAWWRGQLGDGLLAYAECALREDGSFLDIEGLEPRGIGCNIDALAGIGLTPREIGASLYLEYRFRQAGYSADELKALASSPEPLQAAILAGLPYLQTARHAIGLHARSDSSDDEILSWSATCAYLLPDGLYLASEIEARIAGRLGLGAEASLAAPLSGSGAASTEISFWPARWGCTLSLSWRVDAEEKE